MSSDPLYVSSSSALTVPSTPSDEQLAEFKQQLHSWVELSKKINLLKIAIRERQAAQKQLEPLIQQFMATYGYNNINTQEGEIRLASRKVKTTIKLKDLKKRLEEHYGEECLKHFDEGRSIMQMKSLRMIMPKVTMNLKI